MRFSTIVESHSPVHCFCEKSLLSSQGKRSTVPSERNRRVVLSILERRIEIGSKSGRWFGDTIFVDRSES